MPELKDCSADPSIVAFLLTILVDQLVHHFGPNWYISTTIGWIAKVFGTNIHVHDFFSSTNGRHLNVLGKMSQQLLDG